MEGTLPPCQPAQLWGMKGAAPAAVPRALHALWSTLAQLQGEGREFGWMICHGEFAPSCAQTLTAGKLLFPPPSPARCGSGSLSVVLAPLRARPRPLALRWFTVGSEGPATTQHRSPGCAASGAAPRSSPWWPPALARAASLGAGPSAAPPPRPRPGARPSWGGGVPAASPASPCCPGRAGRCRAAFPAPPRAAAQGRAGVSPWSRLGPGAPRAPAVPGGRRRGACRARGGPSPRCARSREPRPPPCSAGPPPPGACSRPRPPRRAPPAAGGGADEGAAAPNSRRRSPAALSDVRQGREQGAAADAPRHQRTRRQGWASRCPSEGTWLRGAAVPWPPAERRGPPGRGEAAWPWAAVPSMCGPGCPAHRWGREGSSAPCGAVGCPHGRGSIRGGHCCIAGTELGAGGLWGLRGKRWPGPAGLARPARMRCPRGVRGWPGAPPRSGPPRPRLCGAFPLPARGEPCNCSRWQRRGRANGKVLPPVLLAAVLRFQFWWRKFTLIYFFVACFGNLVGSREKSNVILLRRKSKAFYSRYIHLKLGWSGDQNGIK